MYKNVKILSFFEMLFEYNIKSNKILQIFVNLAGIR